jgi:hypothetical protein
LLLSQWASAARVGEIAPVPGEREEGLRPGQRPWNPYHVTEYDKHALMSLLTRDNNAVVMMGVHGNGPVTEAEYARVALLRRSPLAAFVGLEDPLEPGFCHVDAQGILEIFAAEAVDAHLRPACTRRIGFCRLQAPLLEEPKAKSY